MRRIFIEFSVYRILSIFVVQTYFVADEYWQSLEVAHAATFGYGYLTWEFKEEIRSFAYPSTFCILYKTLCFLHVDYSSLLILTPRVLQALLSAASDYCFYHCCLSFGFPTNDVWLAVIFDWFSFYCGSRTLINTFEANLVVFGLFCFPWRSLSPKSRNATVRPYLFATIVAFNCFIRPTACVIWAPFCCLWLVTSSWSDTKSILKAFAAAGTLVVSFLCVLDSVFYGSLTFTPWNFLNFNVFKGVSSFYGSHPFHWYFTQGIPVVLGAFTLPFCLQLHQTGKIYYLGRKKGITLTSLVHRINVMLLSTIGCSLLFYSLVAHKEFRFILPVAPMMMIISLQGFQVIRKLKQERIFKIFLILGFAVPVILFGQLHQRGSIAVMKSLASDASAHPNSTALLFLTPCHATPLYSHLHVNVPARIITCEPPVGNHLQDESQLFFKTPLRWLQKYLSEPSQITPTHIVMFDQLTDFLHDFLASKNFSESSRFFHTLFPEGRVSKNMVIYRHTHFGTG